MTRPGVLIDAGNLHVGGGVQVAVSFLDELARTLVTTGATTPTWALSARIEVSKEVFDQISAQTRMELRPLIVERGRWHWSRPRPSDGRHRFDVSFIVFGPRYQRRRADWEIVGFADVTAVYPDPVPGRRLGIAARARGWLRTIYSRRFFRRSDVVVVETAEVARRLCAVAGVASKRTVVIPNALNGVFYDHERWTSVPMAARTGSSDEKWICCISRAYPHKNLAFLGQVGGVMAARGRAVRFLVTLNPAEMASLPADFHTYALNLGPLSVEQLPDVYAKSDAAIFPSLLEAFSAMPLEAMFMERPVFASERPFVRTICGDAPVYFDPLDAASCATQLERLWTDPASLTRHVTSGMEIIAALPTAGHRARLYVDLIQAALDGAR